MLNITNLTEYIPQLRLLWDIRWDKARPVHDSKHKNKGIVQLTKQQTPPSLTKWMFLLYHRTSPLSKSIQSRVNHTTRVQIMKQDSPNALLLRGPPVARSVHSPSPQRLIINPVCSLTGVFPHGGWLKDINGIQVLNLLRIPIIPTILMQMNSLLTVKQTNFIFPYIFPLLVHIDIYCIFLLLKSLYILICILLFAYFYLFALTLSIFNGWVISYHDFILKEFLLVEMEE